MIIPTLFPFLVRLQYKILGLLYQMNIKTLHYKISFRNLVLFNKIFVKDIFIKLFVEFKKCTTEKQLITDFHQITYFTTKKGKYLST